MLFIEAMLRLLTKEGFGGFIVPNSWLTIESAKLLREVFIPRLSLLVDLNYPAFKRVSMEPCIFVTAGKGSSEPVSVTRIVAPQQLEQPEFWPFERARWSHAGGAPRLQQD